ncbi:hypothetical protein DBT_1864 [Dissulfuribacter thermophilus]|uniref:Uncharacterized protein n=1 Tax=Dissulfuribacter thermophilus TaxID=1156395 RepID=A0A1B9F4Q4_9BACT|nr:hypothetical protein DBT_1864 [Dissulfuribacter thermophilus]
MLSYELKEKNFGSFELKLEGRASGYCTSRACFYLLPSAFYLLRFGKCSRKILVLLMRFA